MTNTDLESIFVSPPTRETPPQKEALLKCSLSFIQNLSFHLAVALYHTNIYESDGHSLQESAEKFENSQVKHT